MDEIMEDVVGQKKEKRKRKRKKRRGYYLLGLLFLVLCFQEYVTIETFLGDNIKNIGVELGLKNVLLIASVNVLLLAIVHHMATALAMSEAITLLLGIANYFVDSFRGYGLVLNDLFAIKTATNVAGNYKYTINQYFIAGIAVSSIGFAACFLLFWLGKKSSLKQRYTIKKNIAGVVAIGCICGLYVWINGSFSFWSDVSSLTWDQSIGMSDNGYVLYATANAGETAVKEPRGYSVEKVKKILEKYENASNVNSVLNTHAGDAKSPNLIMIMNESFSDLNVLGTLGTNEPYMPFFQSLQENTIKGYAESSVYGGYTANSEFEFLTGCSKAFISGSPYLQYIHDYMPTVISNIKSQPEYSKAIAMHPYNPSGYNRSIVYPLLHFDQFLSKSAFKNPIKVRKYIGDESDFNKLEELYENKKPGSKLCVFNVTMQNHNAYDDINYSFDNPIQVKNFVGGFEANQYLSLIRKTDDALRNLITYFEKAKEPTIIVMFGDHQPHLPDAFYESLTGKNPEEFNHEMVMKEHLVPFMIWANYDIGEQTIKRTSLNYLSTLMMETAGLKLSTYQKYLLDLYQKLPSISANGYYDCNGKLHALSEYGTPYSKLMDEYEMVQYNYIFDKKNRLNKYYQTTRN